mmetsp:Transcript_9034/g.31909  ORF Transcript_9034/g.31909 Transcript_9034/m.31909 type:complete len:484 (-) Transcript_9034:2603-4054(-)
MEPRRNAARRPRCAYGAVCPCRTPMSTHPTRANCRARNPRGTRRRPSRTLRTLCPSRRHTRQPRTRRAHRTMYTAHTACRERRRTPATPSARRRTAASRRRTGGPMSPSAPPSQTPPARTRSSWRTRDRRRCCTLSTRACLRRNPRCTLRTPATARAAARRSRARSSPGTRIGRRRPASTRPPRAQSPGCTPCRPCRRRRRRGSGHQRKGHSPLPCRPCSRRTRPRSRRRCDPLSTSTPSRHSGRRRSRASCTARTSPAADRSLRCRSSHRRNGSTPQAQNCSTGRTRCCTACTRDPRSACRAPSRTPQCRTGGMRHTRRRRQRSHLRTACSRAPSGRPRTCRSCRGSRGRGDPTSPCTPRRQIGHPHTARDTQRTYPTAARSRQYQSYLAHTQCMPTAQRRCRSRRRRRSSCTRAPTWACTPGTRTRHRRRLRGTRRTARCPHPKSSLRRTRGSLLRTRRRTSRTTRRTTRRRDLQSPSRQP